MITTTYNYSSGSGFVYDASKITFVGGSARLLLNDNPGQSFVPDFAAATFDDTLLHFTGVAIDQIDKRPSNATFYSAWTSQLNANWGNGSTTVTPFNGAAVAGSVLNLSGSTSKYITFNATANAGSPNAGTIEFEYIPQYSGAPSNFQAIFTTVVSTSTPNTNILTIAHTTDGNLNFVLTDSVGTVFAIVAAFTPVSGTTYIFKAQYDSTGANNKLFIDGSSIGSSAATFNRTVSPVLALVGLGQDGSSGNANFNMSNLSFYSAVVNPTSPVLNPTIYSLATAEMPEFTYSGLGALQAFTNFAASASNGIVFTVNGMYWNGSSWVSSSGSVAQANIATVIAANISTLAASNTLQINAIFPAQNVEGQLNAVVAGYTGQLYPMSGPTLSPTTSLPMDALSAFSDVHTIPANSHIGWFLNISGTNYWWNDSAWVASDGSYAQSNPASVVQTHAATLPISLGAFVVPYAILYSTDGLETPLLVSLSVTYDYFGPQPGGPNVCTVFGYISDENNVPISGATVSVSNSTTFINQGIVIAQGIRSTKTDSIGYFSMTLIETATLSNPEYFNFVVTYTQAQVGAGFSPVSFSFGQAIIPNVPEANITSLAFF